MRQISALWKASLIAFVSSFCVMVIELIAARILAPYIGVSLYTWTSIIGIILTGIAIFTYFMPMDDATEIPLSQLIAMSQNNELERIEIEENILRITAADGTKYVAYKETIASIYEIENLSGQLREVAVEIEPLENGRVTLPKKTSKGAEDGTRLVFGSLSAKHKLKREVTVEEGVKRQLEHDKPGLMKLADLGTLPKAQRAVLNRALKALEDQASAERQYVKAVAGREKAERILARKTAIMNSVPNIRRRSKIVRELVEEILKYEKALHEIENMIDRYSQDEHRAKESIPEIFAELELRGNQYPHAGPL